MTATTDRSPDVQHMRDQQARTRALLASLKPIADEDEDTLTGEEDTAPDYTMTTTTPPYRPSSQTRTQEK